MKTWRTLPYAALLQARTPYKVFDQAIVIAQTLGFDFCTYGFQVPFPVTRRPTSIFSNSPPAWRQKYADAGYVKIDPVIDYASRTIMPVIWSDNFFKHAPEFWSDAQAHGMRHGLAQPIRGSFGTYGILQLVRTKKKISKRELHDKHPQILSLALCLHETMSELLLPKFAPELGRPLSPSEKEVMRWTADGKTVVEISTIMTITARTVNFHLTNAQVKLGTTNKQQSAVKAALLGMLN